jgi:hypothetical protein
MTEPTRWRKSSLSTNTADCVEVAHTLDRVRDSKNPTGPQLAANLHSLLTHIKRGDFDR